MLQSIEIENRLPSQLTVKTMQLCPTHSNEPSKFTFIRKMIVSELRQQIHLNPSSQLSIDALASQVLFCFLKSCRISTVSSGGTIIIMKMIFCLPYFTFIISLSTHTHLHTQHHPLCQIPVLSHFAAAIHIFICFLYLLTAVFRHLASLHLRTKNANLFLWHSFYLTLSHSSVF